MAGVIPPRWMFDAGGIYDTRNNSNGGGDSPVVNSFITGGFGGIIDTSSGIRISTVDGPIYVPKARSYENIPKRWKADPRTIIEYIDEESKKKKKARAIKWEKRRKTIKALLHKIKEKLKE